MSSRLTPRPFALTAGMLLFTVGCDQDALKSQQAREQLNQTVVSMGDDRRAIVAPSDVNVEGSDATANLLGEQQLAWSASRLNSLKPAAVSSNTVDRTEANRLIAAVKLAQASTLTRQGLQGLSQTMAEARPVRQLLVDAELASAAVEAQSTSSGEALDAVNQGVGSLPGLTQAREMKQQAVARVQELAQERQDLASRITASREKQATLRQESDALRRQARVAKGEQRFELIKASEVKMAASSRAEHERAELETQARLMDGQQILAEQRQTHVSELLDLLERDAEQLDVQQQRAQEAMTASQASKEQALTQLSEAFQSGVDQFSAEVQTPFAQAATLLVEAVQAAEQATNGGGSIAEMAHLRALANQAEINALAFNGLQMRRQLVASMAEAAGRLGSDASAMNDRVASLSTEASNHRDAALDAISTGNRIATEMADGNPSDDDAAQIAMVVKQLSDLKSQMPAPSSD